MEWLVYPAAYYMCQWDLVSTVDIQGVFNLTQASEPRPSANTEETFQTNILYFLFSSINS